MIQIVSLATGLSPYQVSAAETKQFLTAALAPIVAQRYQRIVDATGIETRQALAPLSELQNLGTIETRNAFYAEQAPHVGESVGARALQSAGIDSSNVDLLIVTSSTGHMVPTLGEHLVSRLRLRPGVRCLSMLGLGCAGAVRAIGVAAELFSLAHVLVISVELCSLWLQVAEPSPEDVLSNVIFGDGAAAVVIGKGKRDQGPEVIANRTELWPKSLDARGARLTGTGFRHFSSPALGRVLRANLRRTVSEFLASHGLKTSDLRFYAINPSDHHMLETIGSLLDLPAPALRPAWQTWEQHGNTLSAGPLHVLSALQASTPPVDGDLGLVLVLGPGITCDMLLLRWHGRLRETC